MLEYIPSNGNMYGSSLHVVRVKQYPLDFWLIGNHQSFWHLFVVCYCSSSTVFCGCERQCTIFPHLSTAKRNQRLSLFKESLTNTLPFQSQKRLRHHWTQTPKLNRYRLRILRTYYVFIRDQEIDSDIGNPKLSSRQLLPGIEKGDT